MARLVRRTGFLGACRADARRAGRVTGDKKTHFKKLRHETGVEYTEMLFFDDEARNRNVEELGVTMYLVRDGVTREVVDRAVREWRGRRGLLGAGEAGERGGADPL